MAPNALELIVLGSSASCPAPGDACSGYLVRQGDTQVLLDCGSGVLGKLFKHTTAEQLSAIVITHFHPDHYLDLITLRYGLRYGHAGAPQPQVLVPPGGAAHLREVGLALRGAPDYFSANYNLVEYGPNTPVRVGELELGFQRTAHDIPTFAVGVQGTGRLVYSSDTSPCEPLEHFAAGADLLLCESTYPAEPDGISTYNHLTSVQAAELGRRAQVGQLVLTHFWHTFPRLRFAAEAQQVFGRAVGLAAPDAGFVVAAGAEVDDASLQMAGATNNYREVPLA